MDLTRLAAELGDKPAVVMGGSAASLSYRELEARSNQIAHLFYERGLRTGDHIAVLMENQLELFPVVWAAQRSGLLYTPVNWHLQQDEAAYIVDNCEAQVLVYAASLAHLARAATQAAPRLKSTLVVGEASEGGLGAGVEGSERLSDAIAGMPTTPLPGAVEGSYMFYSSGTTGRPKGILPELTGEPFGAGLSIDATMHNAFGFGSDSVYLSPGPLYHAAPMGWTFGTVRNGGTVVAMERFDAEQTLALIEKHRVTHVQFVPTMFVRMLKLPDETRLKYDVSSLQVVVHAAAPCPIEVKDRMIEWFGPKLLEYYAGSEGNGFFMIDTPDWLTHKGSVGKALIGTPHICDEDGNELGPNEVGMIWMSGSRKFSYHGDAAKTASVYNDKGWSTLGDLGHLDDEGYLYLSARRGDLILSGGVNIYPREIEDALTLHPAVLDVAVIGLPDDEMGQRVHAVVQPAPDVTPGPELEKELIAFARDHVAHYKAPRSVSFEDVPRLPSGKIRRQDLLKRYEEA